MRMGEVYDSELLLLLKNESDAVSAFEELYRRYWYKLYIAAYKRLKNKELAEELVQDFYTKLWHNRFRITVAKSFEVYAYSSIKYLVINYYSKQSSIEIYTNYKQSKDYDNSTEESILSKDLNSRIDHHVSQLPEKCRGVYELSRKEHKSNKEIATILGISEKTVENHITKALKRLKINLSDLLSVFL